MARTLVVNVTRLGDLLQTQAVVHGLRAQGHAVGLVCLENFATAAGLLEGVDAILPLNGARLMALTDSDWTEAVREADAFVREAHATFGFDRVVNLTPSLSARLLTSLLARGEHGAVLPVDGLGLDDHGFSADSNAWASFMQTAAMARGCSPFNVVDLFCEAATTPREDRHGRLAQPDDQAVAAARGLLQHGASAPGVRGYVGLQPGASEDRRRWPLEHFVAVGDALARAGYVPVLLGAPGEAPLGERYEALANEPCINRIGRTSLGELAGLLEGLDLLVTNDTGTMHYAAGLDVPVLAIFLCTAQPFDTGPYTAAPQSALLLEPDVDCHPCEFGHACVRGTECRTTVDAELVAACALGRLQHGTFPEAADSLPGHTTARLWQPARDEAGLLTLRPLREGESAPGRAAWVGVQRHYYRLFFDGEQLLPWSGPRVGLPEPMRAALFTTLSEAEAMLGLIVQMGQLLAHDPSEQRKRKFLSYWQRVQDLFAANPHVSVLSRMWLSDASGTASELSDFLNQAARYTVLVQALASAMFDDSQT